MRMRLVLGIMLFCCLQISCFQVAAADFTAAVAVGYVGEKSLGKFIEGGRMFAERTGVNTVVITCDGDYSKQFESIRALVSRTEGDIIFLVNACDTVQLQRIAELMESERIYWVSWLIKDKSVDISSYKYWVGHIAYDLAAEGEYITHELLNSIGKSGSIAALLGPGLMLEHDGKIGGLLRVLPQYPEVKLKESILTDGSRESGYSEMEKIIGKYPEVTGVWAALDTIALGVIDCLKVHNLLHKIKVVCIGGNIEIMQYILDSAVVATVFDDIPEEVVAGLFRAYEMRNNTISHEELDAAGWVIAARLLMVNRNNIREIMDRYSEERIAGSVEKIPHTEVLPVF